MGDLDPPPQGKRWVVSRYFGRFVPSRRDRWVFGDRDSGAYLLKFSWTKITRHTLVKGWASPDDPALTSYWAARRRRGRPPLDPPRLRLLQQQRGRCPLCGQLLLHADQEPHHPDDWEQWITAVRKATRRQAITVDARPGTARAAPQCSASSTPTADAASQTAPAVDQHFRRPDPVHAFRACPSRLPGKRAWPVPRGRRRGNAPPLPDWKGPFYRLEAEGFECVLADAKQVENLPGRPKRDPADSRWLAACFERGAVTACFVATPEFRIIRLHTRYRRDLTEERTREKQRAEKLLESAAIKISSVLTDLHGVTGRDIMDHLIAGERNPKVLAQLARAAARRKISQLEEALEGAEFFTAGHAALLAKVLARTGRLSAGIEDLTAVTERLLAPYEEQLQQAEAGARLGPARRPGRRRRNRR